MDLLIIQSLSKVTVLKPIFSYEKGPLVVFFAKIKKALQQFKIGFSLYKPLPIGKKRLKAKSLKTIIESKNSFISSDEKLVLFFEMAKTNNTCVLKIDNYLLVQIMLL